MSKSTFKDTLKDTDFLTRALRAELEKEITAEIEKSVDDLERRLRGKVGSMALSILHHYEIMTMGDTLTIRVRHEQG